MQTSVLLPHIYDSDHEFARAYTSVIPSCASSFNYEQKNAHPYWSAVSLVGTLTSLSTPNPIEISKKLRNLPIGTARKVVALLLHGYLSGTAEDSLNLWCNNQNRRLPIFGLVAMRFGQPEVLVVNEKLFQSNTGVVIATDESLNHAGPSIIATLETLIESLTPRYFDDSRRTIPFVHTGIGLNGYTSDSFSSTDAIRNNVRAHCCSALANLILISAQEESLKV